MEEKLLEMYEMGGWSMKCYYTHTDLNDHRKNRL